MNTYTKIDNIVAWLDSKLTGAWRPCRKFQLLKTIRQLDADERIETVASDGTKEAAKLAHKGDWVVCNVSNENNVYTITDETLRRKYEPTDVVGVYRPKGGPMLCAPIARCCRDGVEFAPPNWGW